jgi:hypothetical protein
MLSQANAVWVIGVRGASLVRNALIFAVDVKTMQVGITPTHGNLNRVMKIGNGVGHFSGPIAARSLG